MVFEGRGSGGGGSGCSAWKYNECINECVREDELKNLLFLYLKINS